MAGGVDLAALNVDIDSSAAEAAGVRFQDLIRAARELEQSIDTVASSSRASGATLTQVGSAAGAVSTGFDRASNASRALQSNVTGVGQALGRAIGSFIDLVARVDGADRSLQQFVNIGTRVDASLDSRTRKLNENAAATERAAQSVRELTSAQESQGRAAGGGGGGGGGPPNPPSPPGGGGGGGGPPDGPKINRLIEDYLTKIGQQSRSGRELEQYTAVRRVYADIDNLTEEQEQLSEIAGLYYDIADAARAAAAAERARIQQAGSNYQRELNESLGITRPEGAPRGSSARESARAFQEALDEQDRIEGLRRQQSAGYFGQDLDSRFNNFEGQAGSARDSARVFEEAARAADELAQRAENLRSRIDPLYKSQQIYNGEVAEAQTLLDAGSISLQEYSAEVARAAAKQQAFADSLDESNRKMQESLTKRANAVRVGLDPSLGIQQRYDTRVESANQLLAAGKLNPGEHSQELAAAQQEMGSSYSDLFAPERRAMADYRKQADDLRASIEPLYSSQRKYNEEVARLETLYKGGYIGVDLYQSGIDKAKKQQEDFNSRIQEGGRRAGLTGQQYFWMLANVKDFINQVAAGGSVSTAILQQGPMFAQIAMMGEGGVGGTIQGIKDLIKGYFSETVSAASQDSGAPPAPDGSPPAPGGGPPPPGGRPSPPGIPPESDELIEQITRFRIPATAAAGAVAALAAAIATLYFVGDAKRKELDRATFGVGRRTGVTAGQIDDTAMGITDAAMGVSRGTARESVSALAATGNLRPETLSQAAGLLKNYAFTTNQEMVPAAKELGEALDGSSGGVDRLNAKIGFLNSSTRELYGQMVASGDRISAQKLLLDELSQALEDADHHLGLFSRTWNLVKSGVGNAFDLAEMGLEKLVSGGTLEEQIAKARADVDALQKAAKEASAGGSSFDAIEGVGGSDQELRNAEQRLKVLIDLENRLKKSVTDRQNAQKSISADDVVKGLNPLNDQIQKVQASLNNLVTARFEWAIPIDKIQETDKAIASLNRQLRQMVEDARAGGAAFNEMLIESERARQTTGFTDQARGISDLQAQRESQLRVLARSPQSVYANDPIALQNERNRINGTISDPTERDKALKDLDTSIDLYRQQIETLTKVEENRTQVIQDQNRIQSTSKGGEFSRAPEVVRGMLEQAVREGEAKRVPLDIMASLIRNESSYDSRADANKNYPNSHAYGYTQLQPGTARGVSVDPRDPQDNIRGGFRYLNQMLEQFNNDMFTALAAYKSGPGATAESIKKTGQVTADGAAYARKVMRDAGMDPGAGGPRTPGATDAQRFGERRSLDERRRAVDAEIRYAGNSQYELDKAQKFQELFNAEMQRTSGEVLPETIAQLKRVAAGFAALNQEAAASRLGKDMQFQLDQLGRSPIDQAGYARLRSIGESPDTEMGRLLKQQSDYLEQMTMMKSTATDLWGSISQGIMSGASAGDIALSMLGKIESKMLDMAGNEIINNLFGQMMGGGGGSSGGGGGFLSMISSLFGGGGGGSPTGGVRLFAEGGVMSGRGRLPLNTYAGGGVASSPQMAVFGEGRLPEAYVPLRDRKTIPVVMSGPGAGGRQPSAFVPLPNGKTIPVTIALDPRSPMVTGRPESRPEMFADGGVMSSGGRVPSGAPVDFSGLSVPSSMSSRSVSGGSAAGNSGPSFIVPVSMDGSSGNPRQDREAADATARALQATVEQILVNRMSEQMRPGGMMYRAGARRSNSQF